MHIASHPTRAGCLSVSEAVFLRELKAYRPSHKFTCRIQINNISKFLYTTWTIPNPSVKCDDDKVYGYVYIQLNNSGGGGGGGVSDQFDAKDSLSTWKPKS